MIEVGTTTADVVKQLDRTKTILEPKAALTFVAIGPDGREVVRLRICRNRGGLILDGLSLVVGRHANMLRRAVGLT